MEQHACERKSTAAPKFASGSLMARRLFTVAVEISARTLTALLVKGPICFNLSRRLTVVLESAAMDTGCLWRPVTYMSGRNSGDSHSSSKKVIMRTRASCASSPCEECQKAVGRPL